MSSTLSRELAKLATKYADANGEEFSAIVTLGAKLRQFDERLIQELNAVIASQQERGQEIVGLVSILAQRVGLLPAPPKPDALPHVERLPNIVTPPARQTANGAAEHPAAPARH
jgi:uncharacterized coiled-coil protein SlyX